MLLYEEMIRAVIGNAIDDSILVVCGSGSDADTLQTVGFRNVVITNLDTRMNDCGSYQWAREDAESLSFADESFDWALVNAGLHHCGSPHKALTEMYRVARKGVIALEARDSLLMRAAIALHMVPQYETEAVSLDDYKGGGLRNGPIPNFIYRWTEREIVKTIESTAPHRINEFRYFYRLSVPNYRLVMLSAPRRAVTWCAAQCARLMSIVAPRQCNQFGWAVKKLPRFKSWMDGGGTALRRDYELGYDPKKYRGYH